MVKDRQSLPLTDQLQQLEVDPVSVISLSHDEEIEGKSDVVTVAMNVSQPVEKIASEEGDTDRRVSARLQSKEKPFYGVRKAATSVDKNVVKKKARIDVKLCLEVPLVPLKFDEAVGNDDSERCDLINSPNVDENEVEMKEVASGGVDSDGLIGKSDYAKVKDTLRIFNNYYLQLVQFDQFAVEFAVRSSALSPIREFDGEEEKRCKKVEDERKTSKGVKSKGTKRSEANNKKIAKASKSKGESTDAEDTKRHSKRPDLKAISKMMDAHTILYPEKRLGHLPGIDVEHQFFSRAEMVVLGFHSHWLNGIDYMGGSYSKMEEYKHYTFPLAVSIVMSGMYEDDLDNSEDIVYTGQGGHNLLGDKRQIQDQVMLRGNLALKNNMEQCLPVRVVRGHESVNSYCGKVYTYDGLYKVVEYWAEKGVSGFTVFKYRLRRLEGQPILTTNQVHFTRAQPPKSLSELRGLVCKDISGGQENIPIPATNVVDNPPFAPTGYVYSKTVQVSEGVKLPIHAPGCSCKGYCIDPKTCACARLNGSDFPYVRKDGGRLVKAKDVLFECGPNCGCGPDCINRVSQNSKKYRLEVFRMPNKGWAVRSWDSIPSGAPICEYTGIIRKTDELDNVSENNFIFDIDCLQTMKGLDGRERRLGDVSIHTDALDKNEDKRSECVPEFCIDAGSVGNVARFINHSCEPNLFVQCVLSSHHDIKLARILLFAADNIPPLQELTYDYGYALDSVSGPDGTIKKMTCYCGAAGCRKRLY